MDNFHGTPVFRSGDKVFIIGNMPDMSRESIMKRMEHFALRFDEYDCPFDFITEFDQWIEWKNREHFNRQHTGQIMCAMVSDIERAKAHKKSTPFKFRTEASFGASLIRPSPLLLITF